MALYIFDDVYLDRDSNKDIEGWPGSMRHSTRVHCLLLEIKECTIGREIPYCTQILDITTNKKRISRYFNRMATELTEPSECTGGTVAIVTRCAFLSGRLWKRITGIAKTSILKGPETVDAAEAFQNNPAETVPICSIRKRIRSVL